MRWRVLVADDHQIFRLGLRGLLEKAGLDVVAEAADGREAVRLARDLVPDVAVIDLSMPILNGLDAMREIRRTLPTVRPILLTMYPDKEYVLRAFRAGARGYVLKTQAADDLVGAIGEVMRGNIYLSAGTPAGDLKEYVARGTPTAADPLTSRERQVLQLVAEGKTTRQIGELLSISFKTAESHRYSIMQKLNIHEVAGLVRYAIRCGLLPDVRAQTALHDGPATVS